MVADEPDFQKYPKTCAEFAGVVAKEISSRLLDGALWCYDLLRHVAMPDRVERSVRGWEGRVWEVGDGEVDGPVSTRGFKAEGELLDDPLFVRRLTQCFSGYIQDLADEHDVGAGFSLDAVGEVPSGGPVDR